MPSATTRKRRSRRPRANAADARETRLTETQRRTLIAAVVGVALADGYLRSARRYDALGSAAALAGPLVVAYLRPCQ